MKLVRLVILIALLQASLLGLCQTVSFSGKNVPLKEIFTVIKNQAGVFFFYDAAVLKDAKPVSIELKDVTLQTALNEIFKDQLLTWVLEDKTVTVIKRGAKDEPAQPPPPILVRGIITDAESNPISGASVLIKGTKNGTVSDHAGRFSIEADQKKSPGFFLCKSY